MTKAVDFDVDGVATEVRIGLDVRMTRDAKARLNRANKKVASATRPAHGKSAIAYARTSLPKLAEKVQKRRDQFKRVTSPQ